MKKIKYALAAAASSIVLALGVALPAAASTDNNCVDNSCNDTNTSTTDNSTNNSNNTDNSVTLGDCAVYNKGDVDQGQGGAQSESDNKVDGDKNDGNSQNSSSSASNTQNGSVNISTDCSSTTNVTNVQGAQVKAPKGGVSAGVGSTSSILTSVLGLFGSVGTAGLGLAIRKK